MGQGGGGGGARLPSEKGSIIQMEPGEGIAHAYTYQADIFMWNCEFSLIDGCITDPGLTFNTRVLQFPIQINKIIYFF